MQVSEEYESWLKSLPQFSKEDKNDLIKYLESPSKANVPFHLRGKENTKSRNTWYKFARTCEILLVNTSNSVMKEVKKRGKNKILLTSEEIIPSLNQAHDEIFHGGRDKMMLHLQNYFFKSKKKIVSNYLLQCKFCTTTKPARNKPPLKPIETCAIRERIVMDLFEMPPDSAFY